MLSPSESRRRITRMLEHPLALDLVLPALFLLLWATGFSVVKIGLRYAEPLTFLALRYACVIMLLLPVQLALQVPFPRSARYWGDMCLMGFMFQFVYFGGTYLALGAGLSAGALALIVSLQPILVGVLSPLWIRESVSRRQWIGLTLGFVGAAVVIISKSTVELTSLKGLILGIASLFGMTLGVLYEKKTGSSTHPILSTLTQSSVGLLLVIPFSLALERGHIEWSNAMLLSLTYLVVCNSLVAIVLLLFLIRHRPAARVSSLFFLVPPGAAIAATVLVAETMPALAWGGIALAAFGVWVSNR